MYSLRDFQLAGTELYHTGLNNSHSGNMSIRNNRLMCITRSGAMLHRLQNPDIIETLINDSDENDQKASREKPVHRAIYSNSDAQAIIHAHCPASTAVSFFCDCVFFADAEGRYFFPDGVPVIEADNAIASEQVALAVVPALEKCPVVIVKGHGTFATGCDLNEALHWTTSVEHSCKIILYKNMCQKNTNE